MKFQSN